MKNPIVFFLSVGLVIATVWAMTWTGTQRSGKKDQAISLVEISKQVRYGFLVRNKTNASIRDGKLWIYAPATNTGAQSVTDIKVSVPFQQMASGNGNQILYIDINDLPPYGTMRIGIQANLLYRSVPASEIKADPSKSYLQPQPFIESDHPDIIKLAQTLKGKDSLETSKNIYDWVSLNIEYAGYIENNRGAVYALQKRKGDCTEFMSLFVALCRAALIPARGVGGYICSGNCILNPVSYHNWAQVFVNDAWRLADCQKKVFDQAYQDYLVMQIIGHDKKDVMKGFRQFRFSGKGFDVVMGQ